MWILKQSKYLTEYSSGSAKYASRTNAGTVVHSYGDEKLLQELGKANSSNDVLSLKITQVPNDDDEVYTKAM